MRNENGGTGNTVHMSLISRKHFLSQIGRHHTWLIETG